MVTDEQMAVLRAYLKGDFEEHDRPHAQLHPTTEVTGYSVLISAAFVEAVEQRFAPNGTVDDVITFVADVRARSQGLSEDIDQHVGERLVLAVYTDEEIDDIGAKTSLATQFLVLTALVVDAQLDDAGLDAFLNRSRARADQWIN